MTVSKIGVKPRGRWAVPKQLQSSEMANLYALTPASSENNKIKPGRVIRGAGSARSQTKHVTSNRTQHIPNGREPRSPDPATGIVSSISAFL